MTKANIKKKIHIIIEIILILIAFGIVNPFIDFMYQYKLMKIKEVNPDVIDDINYLFSPSLIKGDKLLLYISFLIIIICYYSFKYTVYLINEKNKYELNISKIIRIRILLVSFIFIASMMPLLPLSEIIGDFVLAIIPFSFMPMIIMLATIPLVGINDNINVKQSLIEALIIFITLPILLLGSSYIFYKVFGITNRYVITYIITPYIIVFFSKFSSIKNLDKIDKY